MPALSRPPFRAGMALFAVAALNLAASAGTANVTVGAGGATQFLDAASGTHTTTIHAGDTVAWTWYYDYYSGPLSHSTTSGSCTSTTCTPDGIWDSGINSYPHTFSQTFNQAGTYHYFCRVHTVYMQGTIVVAPTQQAGAQRMRLTAPSLALAASSSTNLQAMVGFFAGAGKAGSKERDVTAQVTSWSSSTPTVATVDNTGRVSALAAGTTVILARYGRFQASVLITVQ